MHFTKSTCTVSLLIVGIGLAMNSHAATILVPQNQPTITAGISAASAGDTVAVSPGTYYEYNIPIAKPVTVTSIGNATNTIVDMQHNGRGFLITNTSVAAVSILGLTIQNAQIPYYNAGGAVLIASGKCRISGCIIQGTSGDASYSGGPVANWAGELDSTNTDDVLVDNCIVRNNFAANGCAIASCAVNRCLIYNNSAGNNPAALSVCHATNCTVYSNTGGGMSGGTAVNCILWANSGHNGQQIDATSPAVATYSVVQGGFSGTGNLSSDPLFVNAAAGNFYLQTNSPAKNSGAPTIFNADGSRSDMGAYGGGFTGQPCVPSRATATAQLVNGFVVGATVTAGGSCYTNTPLVLIQGGGGTGATATAIVSNGVVVNIIITDAGVGYTSTPSIYIYSPGGLQIGLLKAVKPSFTDLLLGTNYQLQVSADMNTWTNQGSAFTATAPTMVYPQYWDVANWNTLFFRLQLSP
jgi:hypothetical protein